MRNIPFKNRSDAGRQLAELLFPRVSESPVILAIPRGGVPVGYEIARAFSAPLDTVVVRKIGAPQNPEFGVGAIAPGDVIIISNSLLQSLGLAKDDIDPVIEKEMKEMDRRLLRYRSGEYINDLPVDNVIIVDDGLATGVSAMAAIESIFLIWHPSKMTFAAPVCASDTARALREKVDVVCVKEVDDLVAIGNWYEEFEQTSDEEVVTCLNKAAEFASVPK